MRITVPAAALFLQPSIKLNKMKKISLAIVAFMAVMVAAVSCNGEQQKPSNATSEAAAQDSAIQRGAYLVQVIGCDDCHTPKIYGPSGPEPDPARRLSGHPAGVQLETIHANELKSWVLFNHLFTATVGPWGVSYAANLTSDSTGIGAWTEEQFMRAMREGRYKGLEGGRMLLPPMPWQNFKNLSDGDLKAIFAFLKSTPPVENVVPAPVPPDQLSAR